MTTIETTVSNIATSDGLVPPDGGAWDLLVVGGGTAGLVGAKTAARFGARVLLVERESTGGDCLWTGCVPSKALLAAAARAADARAGARLGVHVEGVTVNFGEVMAHVRAAISTIEPDDSPATLREAGAAVHRGSVRLTGPRTAEVDGTPVGFRQVMVATGASPMVPDLPGIEDVQRWTNETVFGLDHLPERLVVLGGGPIGCELGQAFARLGSAVTLVQSADRLLAAEDPEASAVVTDALRADGVDVRTGVKLTGFAGGRAQLSDGTDVPLTDLLVAVGRRARVDGLGLADAGVDLDDSGHVAVDEQLRTSNPRAWAAGDVTGRSRFTHTAGMHGSIVASNAVLGLRRSIDTVAVPRVTFTHPEVASVGVVGVPEGGSAQTIPHTEVDRAVAEGETAGFSRLVLDAAGVLVGATLVGPRAGESLAEVTLAVRKKLKARDIAATTHAYPTWGDGVWNAAIADAWVNLRRPATARATGVAANLRRRWLDRG